MIGLFKILDNNNQDEHMTDHDVQFHRFKRSSSDISEHLVYMEEMSCYDDVLGLSSQVAKPLL